MERWTFPIYFFVAMYATALYLACTVLLPKEIVEYDGFRGYFCAKKGWFFAGLVVLSVADVVDTHIKGYDYRVEKGLVMYARPAVYVVLALVAMRWRNPRLQAVVGGGVLGGV